MRLLPLADQRRESPRGSGRRGRRGLEDRLGRRIEVEESMPDDTVLFMDPDAIEDGEIVAAHAIACGTVAASD
ncbi:hypothetical protein [Halalkalicoccus salilacus]|uniref:hypothetical protein n=1 Tax=Halalkalicoccus sp. GCM10025704 TaxID=3252662 RepID=UPI00360FB935